MPTLAYKPSIVRNNPTLIFIVSLCWTVLCITSLVLIYEDTFTTVHAYRKLPTTSVNDISLLVGLLPQLITISCTVLALERKNGWAALISFLAFCVDFATDTHFRCGGVFTQEQILISALQSFFLFTVGSELLFVISIENLFDYRKEIGKIIQDIYSMWVIIFLKIKGPGKNNEEEGKTRRSKKHRYQQEEFDMP